MSHSREKVVVAMSGGVDSSVAAALLVEQGYEVMGFFMRVGSHEPAASVNRAADFSPRGGNPGRAADSGPHGRPHEETAESSCSTRTIPSPVGRGAGVSATCAPSKVGGSSAAFRAQSGAPRGATAASPSPTDERHRGCCSASDAADARYVAGMLDVPFYALNFEEDFDRIIDYFADEYALGRTPNPCVVCNDRLKFGKLLDYADAVGAKYIATGHYARVDRSGGPARLMRAVDRRKDQSYVLFGLRREVLDRVLFPLGDLTKDEVRTIARERGLPNSDKPDSVEICFVPDRDYSRIVQERRPQAFAGGEVVDQSGTVVGRHNGVPYYTIGQRRGLGIAAGKPIYVTQLDILNNRVVVGDDEALLSRSLLAERVNILVDDLGDEFRAAVKIRYLHTAVPATLHRLVDNSVRVIFDEPQRAVTPGQAVVFYDGDVVLGGAWIAKAEA